MKPFLALAALFSIVIPARAPAIDFTPRFTDVVDDGIPMRKMFFSDGARRIYYRPPASWSRSGDDRGAMFTPKDSTLARVMIRNSPADSARIPFDETGLEALRKIGHSLVPPDATDVTEIWETVNPVVLQGWTSFEMGFDYIQSGNRFCRAILFVNLDANRQVHFIIDAAPAEFDALYKTTYRTLATWWEPVEGSAKGK